HAKDEIEGVIAAQGRDPEGGLIAMPDVSNDVNRELIIALAARYSVPAVYFNRFFSELGGLISYGDVRSEQFRLAAGYIDRILKVRSRPIFHCRCRPSTSWWSTSRPRRRSAWKSRQPCSPAPTR